MDIHDRETREEISERLFTQSDIIPKETKELILHWFISAKEEELGKQLEPLTKVAYFDTIRWAYEKGFLTTPLNEITLDDVKTYRKNMRDNKTLSEKTKKGYWKKLNSFYSLYKKDRKQDLKNNEELRDAIEYYLESKWEINENKLIAHNSLTQDQLTKLLNACHEPRDACMLMLFAETGRRVGGVLNLKLKDIDPKGWEHGWTVDFTTEKTKTSKGKFPLYNSIPYLKRWLEFHPYKDNPNDPNAYLFTMTKREYDEHGKFKRHVNVPLSYAACRKILAKTKERSGLDVELTPHVFRRTAATLAAKKGLNNAKIEDMYGWKRGSRVLANYVKAMDVEKAAEELHGLSDVQEVDMLKPKNCPVCSEVNPANNNYCVNCYRPLDVKQAMNEFDRLADDISKDPAQIKMLLRFIAERELDSIKSHGLDKINKALEESK